MNCFDKYVRLSISERLVQLISLENIPKWELKLFLDTVFEL